MILLGLLTQAFQCGQSPSQRNWPAYSGAVNKVLGDYDAAMNEVANVDIAMTPDPSRAGATTGSITNDQAIQQLEQKVIPQLDNAAREAAAINVPNTLIPLVRLQEPFEKSIAQKADAYKAMVAAYKSHNGEDFAKARTELVEASDQMAGFRKAFNDAIDAGGPPE